ncbi:MAG: SAM-dependent methyltransferase, partial [Marinoscillum sp.]
MNNLNKSYWNERYDKHETGWDAGEVTTPLKTYIEQLLNKHLSILIPGAGNAHEGRYL